MTKSTLTTAAHLLLSAVPVFAQAPRPLTPPEVLGAAKTIQFTATETLGGVPATLSTAALAQPNKAFFQDTDPKLKTVIAVCASDGKTQTDYRQSEGRYTRTDTPSRFQDIESHTLAFSAFSDFYDPKSFARFKHHSGDAPGVYRTLLGEQTGRPLVELLSLDTATGLPKSITFVAAKLPAEQIIFTNWKLNAPIDDSKFAYAPPADAKLYVAPQLLADGAAAPDFTVQDKDGNPVKLSDYKGKTVVLDFWATWCGPCQSSLPHTTEIAKKYADRNVVVLAVNVWDTPAAFQAWLPKHPEYAPLHFAIDPDADQSKSVASALYGVSGIPTQYVIGPDGTIIKSIVGYEAGDTQLEDALKTTTGK